MVHCEVCFNSECDLFTSSLYHPNTFRPITTLLPPLKIYLNIITFWWEWVLICQRRRFKMAASVVRQCGRHFLGKSLIRRVPVVSSVR